MAIAIASRKISWIGPAWNTFAFFASFLFILANVVFLAAFQSNASIEGNPATLENWAFYGGLGCVVLAGFTGGNSGFWAAFGEKLGLNGFICWLAMLGLVSALVLSVVASIPHTLITPPGYLRVMDDGRVLSAGETAPSPRYSSHSVLVPLESPPLMLSYAIKSASGGRNAVNVEVVGTCSFADSRAFRQLLSAHAGQLGIKRGEWGERSQLLEQVLSDAVRPVIEPQVVEIEKEIRAGMLSGTRASALVRLEQLREKGEPLPPWIASLTVTDLRVRDIVADDS